MNNKEQKDVLEVIDAFADVYAEAILFPGFRKHGGCKDWRESLLFFLDHFAFERNVRIEKWKKESLGIFEKVVLPEKEDELLEEERKIWNQFYDDLYPGELVEDRRTDDNKWKNNPLYPGSTLLNNEEEPREGGLITILRYLFTMKQKGQDERDIVRWFLGAENEESLRDKLTNDRNGLTRIRGISGKIARFFLRDIFYLASRKNAPIIEGYNRGNEDEILYSPLLQPIDRWVARAVLILDKDIKRKCERKRQNRSRKANNSKELWEWVKGEDIVALLERSKRVWGEFNPLKFNQGAWYLGANIAGDNETLEKILNRTGFFNELGEVAVCLKSCYKRLYSTL